MCFVDGRPVRTCAGQIHFCVTAKKYPSFIRSSASKADQESEAMELLVRLRTPAEPMPPPIKEPPPEGPENPDIPVREPEPGEPGEI
jgi:hypothetical protein